MNTIMNTIMNTCKTCDYFIPIPELINDMQYGKCTKAFPEDGWKVNSEFAGCLKHSKNEKE